MQFGDVAGHDINKIDIKVTGADAANSNTKHELLDLISKIQAEIANLTDAPKGQRKDIEYDLSQAQEAGKEGDKDRLLEKFAQHLGLVRLLAAVPIAQKTVEHRCQTKLTCWHP
ncbi:MAG TPA: hypothetical protein VF897_16085 [Roseiflexaceae bacterium]